MTTSEKVVLSGSASIARTDATVLDTPPDMAEVVRLVLLVRRREEIPDSLVTGLVAITRDELAQKYGADPADIRLVSDIVEDCGLRVVSADAASRRVVVEGTLARTASAFNVKFRTTRRATRSSDRPSGTAGTAIFTCPRTWTAWWCPSLAWTTNRG